MKGIYEKKGITLIALVVTIIIMLILAGVAIIAISGNNGLIFRAQDSNEKIRAESVDKEALMWKENAELVYKAGGTPKPLGGITEEGILKELLDKGLMTEAEVIAVLNDAEKREIEIGGKIISFLLEFSDTIIGTEPEEPGGEIISPGTGGEAFTRPCGVVEIAWLDLNNNVIENPLPPGPHLGGMTPVKWTGSPGSYTEVATNTSDTNWYNYIAQTGNLDGKTSSWANAKNPVDGSYFVWIPRYAYKIIYFDSETNKEAYLADNKHVTGITGYSTIYGIVNASDNKVITGTATGITQTVQTVGYRDYIPHPAFLGVGTENLGGGFGTDSKGISGFWVAKFEMSMETSNNGTTWAVQNVNNLNSGNVATKNAGNSKNVRAISRPGTPAWVYVNIANCYENSYYYDRAKDSHLIKNSEWGAVAYLTHSRYGRNGKEIGLNNNSGYHTGWCTFSTSMGAPDVYSASSTDNIYTGKYGVLASSTGNVSGIYDLRGNSVDYTASFDKSCSTLSVTDARYLNAAGGHFASPGGTSTKYATAYDSSATIPAPHPFRKTSIGCRRCDFRNLGTGQQSLVRRHVQPTHLR